MTHNSNLRWLSIEDLSIRHARNTADNWFISKIIQRISSNCVSYIAIAIWTYGLANLTWLDCKKMADELNHPRFSELEKVWIEIGGRCDKIDEMETLVRREMSSLGDRDILMVTSW